MTPPETSSETSPKPPAPASAARGIKIALALSVAVNLAIAGLALGAWLADGPRKGMPRDLSFGPFSEAFTDQDRRALRRALSDRAGEYRTSREAAKAEFETLIATLRAAPFDPLALKSALAAIEAGNVERLQLGRTLIETRLIDMTDAERQAFADRLERGLRRGGKKQD
jgi:uncharacterized membrane protein